jgi:hypothetical protein
MNESPAQTAQTSEPTREETMTERFCSLVLQQTQIALMLVGKAPHPASGEVVRDLDHAQMIIDQLEMLEVKTQGNLNKEESGLLKQSLMTLRLAFVDAVENAPAAGAQSTQSATATTHATQPPPSETTGSTAASEPEDSKKKFTKKY